MNVIWRIPFQCNKITLENTISMQQNFTLTFNITHWRLPFQCNKILHAFQGHSILHTGEYQFNAIDVTEFYSHFQ